MSIFFVVADQQEITIVADSQSSNQYGECLEHGVTKIWNYGNILVGIAGTVELGRWIINHTQEYSDNIPSFPAWFETLQSVIECYYEDDELNKLFDRNSAVLLIAARSPSCAGSNDLVLCRIDLKSTDVTEHHVELSHDTQVFVVPPRDLTDTTCLDILDQMCFQVSHDSSLSHHQKWVQAARLAVQAVARQSRYVDALVQEQSIYSNSSI